ncbi:hypothetical protein [Methanobrevibacter boviskoreani]|uniref:hypothetical protein n=1 Tax=Methanobrevibacter boviskoreani TaxID=1348249 RepID=UPI000595118A|nr:hypothetical protein [Methanobrevibacter boviskoreani]
MAEDIKAAAEKKYKSRMRKFRKVVKSDEEKDKFFNQLGASFEVFLPTKNPDELADSFLFYCDVDGTVVDAEYSYNEGEKFESVDVPRKDLKVLVEAFKDFEFEIVEEEDDQ